MARVWDKFLTERDRRIFGEAGFGQKMGVGKKPAFVIVDVMYDFCGHRAEPIEESVKLWNHSCGEAAWEAIPKIGKLAEVFRSKGFPVFYTTIPDMKRDDAFEWGLWTLKDARITEKSKVEGYEKNEVVREIAPKPEDIVIEKVKPSAFHATPFVEYLVRLGVDTLFVCGTTTSGCVRATVVDGFSHNYRINVVEDCTFDRGEASHAINLFDMNQKYADVVTAEEAANLIRAI